MFNPPVFPQTASTAFGMMRKHRRKGSEQPLRGPSACHPAPHHCLSKGPLPPSSSLHVAALCGNITVRALVRVTQRTAQSEDRLRDKAKLRRVQHQNWPQSGRGPAAGQWPHPPPAALGSPPGQHSRTWRQWLLPGPVPSQAVFSSGPKDPCGSRHHPL